MMWYNDFRLSSFRTVVGYIMAEIDTVLTFELFPGRSLTLLPYHSVKNTQEVFTALISSKLPGTGFLNPAYVRISSKLMCITRENELRILG